MLRNLGAEASITSLQLKQELAFFFLHSSLSVHSLPLLTMTPLNSYQYIILKYKHVYCIPMLSHVENELLVNKYNTEY